MSSVGTARQLVTLAVPKATGTQGDTLVAWGLAIFVSEVLESRTVYLSDQGERYLIETNATPEAVEAHVASFSWERLSRSRLSWLASTEKGRTKDGAAFPVHDRDTLREAYKTWRANRAATQAPSAGDAPQLTLEADASLYPFYEVLTNPGTQWLGYDSFIEQVYANLTPAGAQTILRSYMSGDALEADGATRTHDTKRGKAPRLNPPGFLYPGMNKGPTMRLIEQHGGTVGSTALTDWMLADRGDRPLFELYLAYIGYFQVARLVTTGEQRVIAVPIPARVRVPTILGHLPERGMQPTNLTDYLAAQNALAYGMTALTYLVALQGEHADVLERRGVALQGAHLSVFWRPNGNVYAPSRLTHISLPVWLPALREQGQDLAKSTLEEHERRLGEVRGRWSNERRLSAEQRTAIEAYLRSVGGGLREWFLAVATWFPAVRAAADAKWRVGLWSVDEVWRIAAVMSTEQQPILEILDHPAFDKLASAIRMSTVVPHINRERRKRGQEKKTYPFDADYDLASSLLSAAERGPEDFLREFYSFASRYNDETARPGKEGRRALLRDGDLAQLAVWMHDRRLRSLVPYALLAFGTSLRKKTGDAAGDIDTVQQDLVNGNGGEADTEDE